MEAMCSKGGGRCIVKERGFLIGATWSFSIKIKLNPERRYDHIDNNSVRTLKRSDQS